MLVNIIRSFLEIFLEY